MKRAIQLLEREINGKPAFICLCHFLDKHIPDDAGFRFNYNSPTQFERVWYTYTPEIAARLMRYAFGDVRETLQTIVPLEAGGGRLTYDAAAQLFIWIGDKHSRSIPIEANFTCERDNGNRWVTSSPQIASKLLRFADESCRGQLFAISHEMEALNRASRALDADIEIPVPAGLSYLGYQRGAVAAAVKRFKGKREKYPGLLIADEPGLGKFQPLTAKMLTPKGWSTMGALQVGDYVIGQNGYPTRIEAIYPQGLQDVYAVTFSDGSRTECGLEHLWTVNTSLRRWQKLAPRVKTLQEILAHGLRDRSGKRKHYIPLVQPVHFDASAHLPLEPYLLGALLGDGGLKYGPRFSSADTELIIALEQRLPAGYVLQHVEGCDFTILNPTDPQNAPNKVWQMCKQLDIDVTSEQKFIPDIYKYASVEDRFSCLQGLMDTDGWISDGVIGFSSASERLCDDVRFLIESLGGRATKRIKLPWYTYKGERREGLPAFALTIAFPIAFCPFRLKRKASQYRPRQTYRPSRAIENVEYIGQKLCQCIKVAAGDGLYVTDDFIVTHNTIEFIGILNYFADHGKTLLISPAGLKVNWLRELQKWLVREHKIIMMTPTTPQWKVDMADIVIVNYDVLRSIVDWEYLTHTKKGELRKHRLLKINGLGKLDQPWDFICSDESHVLKNKASQRSRFTFALVKQARRPIFLTGSPIVNFPIEIFPLINALDPQEWPNWYRFAERYANAHVNYAGVLDTRGGSNLEELSIKLRSSGLMIRRLKVDVLKELPPKRRQVIEIDPGQDKTARAAIQAELSLASELGWSEDEEGFAKVVRALEADEEQLSFRQMSIVRHQIGRATLPYAIDHLKALWEEDPGKKIVAWGWHHDVLQGLVDEFREQSVLITGKASSRVKMVDGEETSERMKLVDRFNSDPSCVLCAGQIQAAGVGLTMTASAHHVFIEEDFRPSFLTQSEDRSHRIGQLESLLVQHIVLQGSFTARMIQRTVAKQLTIRAALGDTVNE